MMKKLKKVLIILLGISIQMSMYNYVNAYGSTSNVQEFNWNVNIEIISATSKKIKIKIINKEDDIAHYAESFVLYKYKKGEWKKIKRISPTPKTLYLIKGKSSKTKTIVCEKTFGKELPKGKYKLKWIQSNKFTIK